MKLFEITSLGDDNSLGFLLNNATTQLKKIQKSTNKETRSVVTGLLTTLEKFNANPNILQTDGYSLLNYLKMLDNPKITIQTLRLVGDALGSYEDDSSD